MGTNKVAWRTNKELVDFTKKRMTHTRRLVESIFVVNENSSKRNQNLVPFRAKVGRGMPKERKSSRSAV